MELIEQLNVIEVGLLTGIFLFELVFGIIIFHKVRAIDRGLAFARISDSKNILESMLNEPKIDQISTRPTNLKIETPKQQPGQEIPIQEQLKKTILRTEPVSAKGTCDWCGNEYSNLPVHKRFCKSKPPAT